MIRTGLRRFAKLLLFLLSMGVGLCGTSLGTAFLLNGSKTGMILLCAGCLPLYMALYIAWILPRRRPVDPE